LPEQVAFDVGGFAGFVGEGGFAVETEGVALSCCCGEEGPGEGEFALFLCFDGLAKTLNESKEQWR